MKKENKKVTKDDLEIIKKRLGLENKVAIWPERDDGFYMIYFPDGFKYRIYSENRFYYKRTRDYYKGLIDLRYKEYLNNFAKYRNYKEYSYCADAGSLALGNENLAFSLHNGYGDGCFKFRVYDEDIDLDLLDRGWKYETVVNGNFYIFDYDCLKKAERAEEISRGQAVELNGRYAIYRRHGRCNFAFVKTSDI